MIRKGVAMDIWSLEKQGLSCRAIAARLGIDRRTVKKYLDNPEFPTYHRPSRGSHLEPHYQTIRDLLEEDSYTATRIYQQIKNQNYSGSYEIVKRYVRSIKQEKSRIAYLRFETQPGLQAQVDFADFKVQNENGTESVLYLFAMVLGYSRAMYVEVIDRCTMKQFLECHQRAFDYLGGVPGEVLYDNMKNVVIRRLTGKVEWNKRFEEFAVHYRYKPIACPPYAPWCKGKVERPIGYVRESVWRGYRFRDLDQTNQDLKTWLDQTANKRIHGTLRDRVNRRWEIEKPNLGDIPNRAFDTSDVYYRKVYKDCMVQFQCNAYRVPHASVGKMVTLKVNQGRIRVFHTNQLLVEYPIPDGKGRIVENLELFMQLKQDITQSHRKYRTPQKAKATRGLVNDTSCHLHRNLDEYDRCLEVAS